jgi:steroid 5-alpha reductase family enzyme
MADSGYRIGRGFAGQSRATAFAIVTGAYVVALLAALGVASMVSGGHPITVMFLADIAATVAIFLLSMVVANSSLYDPYWSVAPPLIIGGWLVWHLSNVDSPANLRHWLMLGLVTVWAVRLTANWAVGWSGLGQEDWRYVRIREDTTGRLPWWLVSFIGIQLVPTLFVFLGLLSAWPAIIGQRPFGIVDVLAVIVMVAAILLETLADLQLRAFASDAANRGKTIDVGLWRVSRHPNYLGEIMLWWGLWLFGLAAAPNWWWTIIGPLGMVALFLWISIPLMERRSLERRGDYAKYQQEVSVLLPWPRR